MKKNLENILSIIEEVDKALSGAGYPEMDRNGDFTLYIRVSDNELPYIDRELYFKTNGTMDGYNKADDVRMEMYGISVVISTGDNSSEA